VAWVEGAPIGAAGVALPGTAAAQARLHRDLGALIARVHAATAALALPAWFARPAWDAAGLVGETPFWGRFWEHPALAPPEAAALAFARGWLAERIADHARRAATRPIHADVLRENVLAGPAGLTLIDFDDCGTGFALYDLGTVLSQGLDEPAFPAIRTGLIEGYGSGDGAMVDAFTLMRCCASVGWAASRLPPGHPVHRRHIARALRAARRFGAVPGATVRKI
jgi:Ser/Thr protein kinase RdoA (MazF antagonist)